MTATQVSLRRGKHTFVTWLKDGADLMPDLCISLDGVPGIWEIEQVFGTDDSYQHDARAWQPEQFSSDLLGGGR